MNTDNLKPFTGADDERRQNGRRKGSRNISTIVKEILDSNINDRIPISEEVRILLNSDNDTPSYAKAVALAMTLKAIGGDVRAATWVSEQYDKSPNKEGAFDRKTYNFTVIPNARRKDEDDTDKPIV